MKKIIFIIALFLGLFAQAQKLKADAVKYKAVTTLERDAFTVPAGEFWRIYNVTNNRFEFWDGDSWEAFVASGGESTTVSDTAEIDLTLTGDDLTAAIVTGSVDVLKLDAGVQASLALADSALQTEVDGSTTNEIQNASQVASTPSGNLIATDVQGALNELQTELDTFTDDQTAAEVANTPSGNLIATDVQAALNELQTELDGVAIVDDTAFGVSWNSNNDGATKNSLYDYLINLASLTADDTAYGVSWNGNLAAATKNAIYDKIETLGGGSESTTVTDTAEIDLTLTGTDIEADIQVGSVDILKLDAGVQASLALADSALQTEVDGSTSNELQNIANTSDATTHTATLSNSGGSLQLAEGANITLTTSGTGLNGVVTIASTGGAGESTTVSDTAEIDLTLTGNDITAAIVTGSIDEAKLDTSVNASLDLADSALQSFTEVDGSTTNELNSSVTMTAGSLGVVDAGGTQSVSLISTDGGNTITAGADGKLYSAAGAGESTTVSDTAEIDLTLTGSDVSAAIVTGSIDEAKLDASVNASLDLADSALQSFTEVDGSITNEGSLTVAAGTGTTSIINSNTSGSTGVTLTAGTNMTISEVGNVITFDATGGAGESTTVSDTAEIDLTLTGNDITAAIVTGSVDVLKLDAGVQASLALADSALQSFTEVDGSTSNELQTISNTSDATTHTSTLSNSGGSTQFIEGSGITLTTGGTGLNGTVTIAATGGGADGLGSDGDKGDITVGGSGTTLTIDSDAVTYSKLQNSSVGFTVLGKTATGAGDFAEIVAGADGVLRRSGTGNVSFGSLVTNNYSNASVTLAKMANIATGSLIYRKTAGTGVPEVNTLATLKTDLGLTGTNSGDNAVNTLYSSLVSNATHTGDVTGSTALTIASSVVDSDNIINGTIDELDLDTSVNASLDLADSAVQQTGSPLNGYVTTFSSSGVVTGTSNLTYSTTTGRTDIGTGQDVLRLKSAAGSTYVEVDAGSDAITVAGDLTATSLAISGGTGSQFLKANGTTDSNTYLTTEVDGSTSNELQTIANTSDATTHTATLSNSGGSLQLAEGSNITLTTSGTGLNGIVTIASSGGGGGDVSKVGTPVNNQGAFWTGDGTLEGEPNFAYSGTQFDLLDQTQVGGKLIIDTPTSGDSVLKFEIADANKAVIGTELGILGSGSANDFLFYVYGSNEFGVMTNGVERLNIAGTGEVNAFVSMESPTFIDTNGTTSTTGTALDLSDNITGKIYNEATPSTATAFTTTNLKTGGFAYTYINSASEPTVDGSSTETGGSVFESSTLMKLVVYSPDGTTVEHFFVSLGTPSAGGAADDTAYGVSWNGNTDAATKNAIYDKIETLGGGITELSKTITIESPTSSEDISIFFTNKAITVTEIRAITVGTSPSTTWTIKHETNRSSSGNAIITAGTTTTSQTSGNDLTTFNDATILADSFIWLETTAQSGTVQELSITIFYTED